MRILLVHNRYSNRAGEDAVFERESTLLGQHGHQVTEYSDHNRRVAQMNRVHLALKATWSREAYQDLLSLIRESRPNIVHFHNTFPLISPSGYYACRSANVPVVQTLHNYRLLCPAATFFRNGGPCEDCMGKNPPWPGAIHGCYQGSRLATGAVGAMLFFHRVLRTWRKHVNVFIAPTEFARGKFTEGGIPESKLIVKPNFVHPDPGIGQGKGSYVLFAGRLSQEKGVLTLLRALSLLEGVRLMIVGDGPLRGHVQALVGKSKPGSIEFLGRQSRTNLFRLMRAARFLVFPSEWYETFGLVMVEAFACGLPVIASRLGAMAELVDDGRTGLLFRAGDSQDLGAKIEWAWTHPAQMDAMGREARKEYEGKYTAERNYRLLMKIYELARA